MITRDQYLEALATVHEYTIQTMNIKQGVSSDDGRVLVSDWMAARRGKLPVRVVDALLNPRAMWNYRTRQEARPFTYMDEITKRYFLSCPGVGKKTWVEFCEIAGINY